MSAKQLTVSYTDLESKRLTFTDLEENERSKGQLIAYPRYDHPTLGEGQSLMLQLPWSEVFTYGVPREGDYYKNDYDRGFLKYPVNQENDEQMVFANKMIEIDSEYGSDDKKKKMFGKKAKKYVYTPIFRESQVDDDDEDAVKRPPYMKFKLDLSWPDGEVRTKVYTSVVEDGKRVRTEQEVKTVDDFAGIVRYRSRIRPIIRPVKMWGQPASRKDPGYGIVWKIVKIEVEPSAQTGNSIYNSYYKNDGFLDSDDDEDEVVDKTVHQESDDSDDSDESDDSDSDEEPVKKSKGKKKSKSSSK